MKYTSTRDNTVEYSFEEVVFEGLAPRGGLFVPKSIPKVDAGTLESWENLSFPELATEVMKLFIEDEIAPEDLAELAKKSYATFSHPDTIPLVDLKNDLYIFEIFHGPTFAFKDVALQFLGNLFEFFLKRRKTEEGITVLGATSGDTGSAAIYGLRGKENINVFILFPTGRVAPIQERQMTTVLDKNVHNVSVDAYFDDCQNLVKEGFLDTEFRRKYNLAAVNSINWARILAQIVYYFYSYFSWKRLHPTKTGPIDVCVPTGNFGNALAGYYAQKMGLPIRNIGVATNSNDLLYRFLSSGSMSQSKVIPTIAPAMDIQISSNFERYLYYLCGEDSEILSGWMTTFKETGSVDIPAELGEKAKAQFFTGKATDDEIRATIKLFYEKNGYIACPHSACGLKVCEEQEKRDRPLISMGTAHPAKFGDAVEDSIQRQPDYPEALSSLVDLPTRCLSTKNDFSEIKRIVAENV